MTSLAYPPIRQSDRFGNFFVIKNKQGYVANKNDNKKILKLYEKRENETIYIENEFVEDEFCLVGHELAPTYLSDAEKVDFLYIFFQPRKKSAYVFIYEMKKSIGKCEKTILHMFSQCTASIKFALSIVDSMNDYVRVQKSVGVFTENWDDRALNEMIKTKENQIKTTKSGFLQKKLCAQNSITKSQLNILKKIASRKFVFDNEELPFDCRLMSRNSRSYSLKVSDGTFHQRSPAIKE